MEDMDLEETIKAHEESQAARRRSNRYFWVGLSVSVIIYFSVIALAVINP